MAPPIDLSHEIWDHGLIPLPGASLSEDTILALTRARRGHPAVLAIDQWTEISAEALGLTHEQAEASFELAAILSDRLGDADGDRVRIPLATLLLWIWVQYANGKLTSMMATASRSKVVQLSSMHYIERGVGAP
eukprot:scaffold180611_cov35-Tisochrysis_lutea.AAC.3